jgi:O-antigen ligase
MLRWLRVERDAWRMVGAWLIASALVGREGAEQFFFGQTWSMEGVGRVSSIYPSATAFGIYMGRALPLALVLALFLPARWHTWRIAAALLAVPMALGVLFSFARGAWIGVFAAMLVVAIVTWDRRVLIGLGVAVLGGLAALPFIGVDRIISIFDWSTPDNTGVSRLKIWSAALRILGDHPLTGIGQDQFLYADPKYEVPHVRFLTVSHPHDMLLDFWLRLGLPGLAWLLAALGYFAWRALGLWRGLRGTALGALALGLLASLVDFAVHGLLDMAYFTMDLALTFWLTVGLVVVVRRLTANPEAPRS